MISETEVGLPWWWVVGSAVFGAVIGVLAWWRAIHDYPSYLG